MRNRGQVRAKKHLGQHFLKDESIAQRIANVVPFEGVEKVLEIGPGMGVMTKYLLDMPHIETWVVEIDQESVSYLKAHYNQLSARILEEDFLKWNPSLTFGKEKFALIGNFPYNISSQIVFKVLEHMDQIPMVFACFSAMGGFKPVATTNLETRFLSGAKGERITCAARVIKQGRSLIFCEATLTAMPSVRAVASASATFFVPD